MQLRCLSVLADCLTVLHKFDSLQRVCRGRFQVQFAANEVIQRLRQRVSKPKKDFKANRARKCCCKCNTHHKALRQRWLRSLCLPCTSANWERGWGRGVVKAGADLCYQSDISLVVSFRALHCRLQDLICYSYAT